MDRSQLPLNGLRAFEASARRLSFTDAAQELCVTQAAVSHQVKRLEARLGVSLFTRLPRGLVLTDEGQALLPTVTESFESLGRALRRFEDEAIQDVVSVSAVGTFAVRWLLPRLPQFKDQHPAIDLRVLTNTNAIDFAADAVDFAILFGEGDWPGLAGEPIFEALLTPLCSPQIAAGLKTPADLARAPLLRCHRTGDWPAWFKAAGATPPRPSGPVFDSLGHMAQAALQGAGVALGPAAMFREEIRTGQLVQPFEATAHTASYWLVRPKSRPLTGAMRTFADWCRRPEFRTVV
jgi:LysR family transcriptional regulator of beta-lactamase